jgi:hypothetical protein
LLLTIAGLGTVVVLELARSIAIAPEVTAAAPATAAAEPSTDGTKFRPPPERQFDEISDRPLFFSSRRPFVAPAEAGPEPASPDQPTAKIELVGVLLSERERAALVQSEGEDAAHWVHEQQTVAGRLVEEIAADRIRVRDGDNIEVITLRRSGAIEPKTPTPSTAADRKPAPSTAADRKPAPSTPAGRKEVKHAKAQRAQTTPVR